MKKRFFYIDLVKVVAIYLVLFAHSRTYGTKLYTLVPGQTIYPFYLWLDCIRTINIPLFFMASGALLLKPENDGSDSASMHRLVRRIMRYLAVLVVFSFLQYAYRIYTDSFETIGILDFLKNVYSSPIHYSYWFIYAYLGYLIMLPFIYKIACGLSKLQFRYLIFIMVMFMNVLPLFQILAGVEGVNTSFYTNVYIYSVFPIIGCLVYPVIGFYLHNHMDEVIFDKKWKIYVITGLAILGSCVAAGLTHFQMLKKGEYTEKYISYFNILTAIAVFCICYKLGQLLERKKLLLKLISTISSCVFGIYLFENIIEDVFSSRIYEFIPIYWQRLTVCAVYMTLTVVLGTFITLLLKKVPVLGKLL